MNKIAFLITTFERDELLFKSVESLIPFQKENMHIIIVDQGNTSYEKEQWIKDIRFSRPDLIHYRQVPFNSGLSFCRNFGVNFATELGCKYCVIGSDSFLFNETIECLPLLPFCKFDLYGFELSGCKCGWEAKLELIKGESFQLDFIDKSIKKLLYSVDICRNFFIATTKSLLDVKWDNKLKLAEHESIHGDSPVFLKNRHGIYILPIKYLMRTPEPNIKKSSTESKNDLKNYHIWTDNGWSKIKYITRHPCVKKMYRLLTSNGYIECTSDHSLIIDNNIINPESLRVGDKLEHCTYPLLSNKINYDKDLAWLLGFFLANGSYSRFIVSSNHIRENVRFTNTKKTVLVKCQKILNKIAINSKISKLPIGYNGSYNKKEIYALNVVGENRNIANLLFSKFYFKDRKLIPSFVYDFNKKSRKAFLNGFIIGDGYIGKKKRENSYKISQKESCIIEGLKYLSNDIWISTLNYVHHNNELYYKLNINKSNKRMIKENVIKKIEIYDYNGFVYDIETENHHFCGGIGNVNLHNSFFWEYKQKGYKCAWTPLINAEKMTDRPNEYSKYRQENFRNGMKCLCNKWGIKGWVSYKNLDRAKKRKD